MTVRPLRLAGSRGLLTALYYEPLGLPARIGDVLFVPSFGEELNRCRSMVSTQARRLAGLGIGTLILDPYGTGDSTGKHAQGTWSGWREDLRLGIEWLRAEGHGCSTVWGVRLGAVMASELASGDPGIERLLLWQPVMQGKTFYTQFLRIRVAAELEQSDGVRSTEELRRWSRNGETLEVSGYHINPTLAQELDEVKFKEPQELRRCRLLWLEVVASEEAPVSQANRKALEAFRAADIALDFKCVVGPLFWHVHERVVAPQLLYATEQLLAAVVAQAKSPTPRPCPVGNAGPHSFSRGSAEGTPEDPVVFPCEGEDLVGVLHRAESTARRGVVIVVAGGPQYRAGAHRQFVSLARTLVTAGYPVLRFDLRGMGDSSGAHRGFQHSNPDIRAAIDALLAREPQLKEVVLFGECESASGILFYAFQDPRVKGVALINPWVRTQESHARVIVKHYYSQRLLSREFWRKVFSGKFRVWESLGELARVLRAYWAGLQANAVPQQVASTYEDLADLPLPIKTAVGLRSFDGQVLILMSGRDYIAREFDEVVKESKTWDGLLANPRIKRLDLAEADHTFSRDVWRSQAADSVRDWIDSW